MGKLIGTDPNQVPANASLGTMAFQDYDVVTPLLMGGRRNIFINGDFNIAQRGTSFTSSSGGYMLDRWTSYIGEGTWTVSQDDDVPGGYSKSMKWLVSTADSTPTTATHVSTRVEGQDLQGAGWGTTRAKPLILSFWVKSNAATRHNVEMDMYHPDNSYEVAIPHYQINEIDTWEFKTIVIPPTSQGFRNTEASALLINIFISCGGQFHAPGQTGKDPSDYVGFWAPSNTFTNPLRGFGVSGIVKNVNTYVKWAGMQLEVDYSGTGKPTPFEHRSYGEELAMCERYYERLSETNTTETLIGLGMMWGSTRCLINLKFNTEKRTNPTVSFSGSNHVEILNNNGWRGGTSLTGIAHQKGTRIDITGISGATGDQTSGIAAEVRLNPAAVNPYIEFDAEL
jgi:hypothetical protein